MACAVPRAQALPSSPLSQAASTAADAQVHLIDLTDQLCDLDRCYPVVGNLIVYRDYSHLAVDYVRALVPYLSAAVASYERQD